MVRLPFLRSPSRTRVLGCLALAALASAPGPAGGATVLYSKLDSLAGWTVRTAGPARAEVVAASKTTRCVALSATRGTALLTRTLDLHAVRGTQVRLVCLARTEAVVPGPQATSTAKVHLAVQTPGGVQHHAARLTGTTDWQGQGLTLHVPADATRVVLNLGLESCSGRMLLRHLVVKNDRRAAAGVDLSAAANGSHDQLHLPALPAKDLVFHGVRFRMIDPARAGGMDLIRLRGTGHMDWPAGLARPIPVGRSADAIYILHAVLGPPARASSPCAVWKAHFAGGYPMPKSLFQGRQIGSVEQTKDLSEWQVAWRAKTGDGKTVTFGVTKWPVPGPRSIWPARWPRPAKPRQSSPTCSLGPIAPCKPSGRARPGGGPRSR